MRHLTIGEVAKIVGVNIQTVRYYERQKLIPAPPRRESGYRQYPEERVRYIRFIKRAQGLGFTLREIAGLLALRVGPDTTCGDVKMRAEEKIADIEGKIRTLQKMREVLTELAASCSGSGSAGECPILEALEAKEEDDAEE
jgi:Hg(II)-responsive transcriptional regulator